MERALQSVYIKPLNFVYNKYISKMNLEIREAYVRSIFYLISVYFIVFYSKALKTVLFTYAQRETLLAALLALSAVLSMTSPLKPIRWKKCISVPYFASAMGLVITGIMHPIGSGYMCFGTMMIFVYPLFYLVWNNRRDYDTLFEIAAKTNLDVGTIYFIYCVIVFNKEMLHPAEERFRATIGDANLYGFIGMGMICAAAYLLYRKRWDLKRFVYYIVGVLMGLAMVVQGQSRSALMVSVLAVFVVAWFRLKISIRNNNKYIMMCAIFLLILVCATSGFVIAARNTDAESSNENGIIARLSPAGKDLNSFTSGRIVIWNNYARHLNLTGNNFEEIDWDEMTGDTVKHAHNNFLEYGYRSGIVVASLFTMLELAAGILSLYYLFSKKRKKDYYAYVVIYMIMYTVMSLLDIATIPSERYAPFYFYLAMCVFIDGGKRLPAKDEHQTA